MKRIFSLILCISSVLFGSYSAGAQTQLSQAELISRVTFAYPAYSPDGSKIAYMSNADGDFDIYVLRMDKRILKQLTDAPDRDGTPVWSHDGSRIAFQSFRDGHSQIYIMDADGGNQQNISQSESHDEHPFFSADGRKILFCSDRSKGEGNDKNNFDIFEMNVDGSQVRQITRTPEVETYASWSPDGKKIVCRKILNNGDWEVVVMNSDGSDPRNISKHKGVDGWPVWSPDGRKIAFASEEGDHTRIFVMNPDGTGRRVVSGDAPTDDRQPFWHPGGALLLFARYQWFRGQPWYEASEIYITKVAE